MSDKIVPLPRKPPVTFTPELKEEYLALYRQMGFKYLCGEMVGVHPRTIDHHVKSDPEFAERSKEAKRLFIEENYVKPARQFAFEGVQEPIIGGKERDQIVAYKKNIATNLTAMFLKQADQSFRDGSERVDEDDAPQAGATGDVQGFVAPSKALDTDDWRAKYQNAAKGLKPDGTPYES